jgi:hypothetical protein
MMFDLKLHWVAWLLLLLVVYMAIKAPSTLGAVVGAIGHLVATVAAGLTHFAASVTHQH